MKLLSGTASEGLATAIADVLDMPLTDVTITRFRDQEIFVRINENVRGEDIFLIQSTSAPANDHLMELLIMVDALLRASAARVTAVIPYFGYSRQDRKVGGRTPISAKLVANLISRAGADRVLTLDLHAGQIQGFFDIPTDNLFGQPVFEADIRSEFSRKELKDILFVSPDTGGVVRARALAKKFEADIAIIDKRRPKAGESEVMNIIGDVTDRNCIILDDIIDSGGTLCKAADALMAHGAKQVSAYITHGVLSDPAVENVNKSALKEVVITDTIAQPQKVKDCDKIREVSVARLLGEAIRRIANAESVSKLFD